MLTKGLKWLGVGTLLALLFTLLMLGAPAADHRDGPIFGAPMNITADINDIYLFRSPLTSTNTVIILSVQPFPGFNGTPTTFDPKVTFDLKIDNNGDALEDLTFRVTFGPPTPAGQDVLVRALPASRFPPTGIVARGKTETILPIRGADSFRRDCTTIPSSLTRGRSRSLQILEF